MKILKFIHYLPLILFDAVCRTVGVETRRQRQGKAVVREIVKFQIYLCGLRITTGQEASHATLDATQRKVKKAANKIGLRVALQ